MAQEISRSQAVVPRIWRAFGLPLHRQETLKLLSDPQFVGKPRYPHACLDSPLNALLRVVVAN
jgi:hypothetical protein